MYVCLYVCMFVYMWVQAYCYCTGSIVTTSRYQHPVEFWENWLLKMYRKKIKAINLYFKLLFYSFTQYVAHSRVDRGYMGGTDSRGLLHYQSDENENIQFSRMGIEFTTYRAYSRTFSPQRHIQPDSTLKLITILIIFFVQKKFHIKKTTVVNIKGLSIKNIRWIIALFNCKTYLCRY